MENSSKYSPQSVEMIEQLDQDRLATVYLALYRSFATL